MIARGQAYGGQLPGRAQRQGGWRSSIHFPTARDFASRTSFERGRVAQALIDIGAVLIGFVLSGVVVGAIAGAIYVFLFYARAT